jgi:undecaprenyl-diphosphatase
MLDLLLELDTQLFLFLNGLNNPFWDPIMVFFSAKFTMIPFYLLIVLFMFKKFGGRAVWALMGIALVIVLADKSSVLLFKNVFQRLRPCHNPEIADLIHLAAGKCYGKFGFVSSHAANSFGVAVFLALLIRKRWFLAMMIAWASIVSYSRIYLGVHYPGDIIFGGLLGAFCGYCVWNLLVGINRVKPIINISAGSV